MDILAILSGAGGVAWTVVFFVLALAIIVAVHEYGHYRVAVACGVRVLVFSIGFGKTIYRWRPKNQRPGQNTEFVIGALPLGGYIQMLDSREADVPADQLPFAFDQQSLRARASIVAAGPLANLLLAVVLFSAPICSSTRRWLVSACATVTAVRSADTVVVEARLPPLPYLLLRRRRAVVLRLRR